MGIKIRILSLFCMISLSALFISTDNCKIFDTGGYSQINGSCLYSGDFTEVSVTAADSEYPLDLSYTPQYDNSTQYNNRFHYLNTENVIILRNNVTVAPVEVYAYPYYNNCDRLFVHCRIYNGYDYEISDINVDWMDIYIGESQIFYKSNISCKGLTIGPHECAIYTFTFDDTPVYYTMDLSDMQFEIYAHAYVNKPTDTPDEESVMLNHLTPDPYCTYSSNYHNNYENMVDIYIEKAYYKGDRLVLYCNIYNGYNYPIQSIRMNWANLYSNGRLIAQGNIGTIYKEGLKSKEKVSCKIEFDYNLLIQYNSELIDPYLRYYYSYSYK